MLGLFCTTTPTQILDWTGLAVTVLATKFMYEVGSPESRKPPHRLLRPVWHVIQQHALTIFLLITAVGWVVLFARSDANSKWGQVAGNIVSEWTQILGWLIVTKKLMKRTRKRAGVDISPGHVVCLRKQNWFSLV